MAAEDPVLASEIKYRLTDWSSGAGPRLRWTVAHACGTNFGASRPDLAMRLLRNTYRGRDGDEHAVGAAVRDALRALFRADRQPTVFRHLVDWVDRGGSDSELALWALPSLLWEHSWWQEQLVDVTDFTEKIIELVRRALNDDELFDATSRVLRGWCHWAHWYEQQTAAVETLLSALAQDMKHGELCLFVEIDRSNDADLAGRDIARHALQAWRQGEPRRYSDASPNGGNDDH